MKNPTYNDLKAEYKRLWLATMFTDRFVGASKATAAKIVAKKDRYLAIEEAVGVPWWMVGALHALESGCTWSTHLHNGDPLSRRTKHVPAGRPLGKPPFTWEESAIDALTMKGFQQIADWPIERVLYECERYNGFGYRKYHPTVLSPYLWSGTHWGLKPGKYVADGRWSSTAVSGQTGVVAILHRVRELDQSVEFTFHKELAPEAVPVPAPNPNRVPEVVPDPIPLPPETPVADALPVPETYPKAEEARVTEALKTSRTLTGAMMAGVGTVSTYFDSSVATLTEAAGEVAGWGPAKTLLEQLGLNIKGIGFGLAVAGLTLVVARRINAAAQGKQG